MTTTSTTHKLSYKLDIDVEVPEGVPLAAAVEVLAWQLSAPVEIEEFAIQTAIDEAASDADEVILNKHREGLMNINITATSIDAPVVSRWEG